MLGAAMMCAFFDSTIGSSTENKGMCVWKTAAPKVLCQQMRAILLRFFADLLISPASWFSEFSVSTHVQENRVVVDSQSFQSFQSVGHPKI